MLGILYTTLFRILSITKNAYCAYQMSWSELNNSETFLPLVSIAEERVNLSFTYSNELERICRACLLSLNNMIDYRLYVALLMGCTVLAWD